MALVAEGAAPYCAGMGHVLPLLLNVLAVLMPAILVAGGLVALYWVVRRAVAAGIRDARSESPAEVSGVGGRTGRRVS